MKNFRKAFCISILSVCTVSNSYALDHKNHGTYEGDSYFDELANEKTKLINGKFITSSGKTKYLIKLQIVNEENIKEQSDKIAEYYAKTPDAEPITSANIEDEKSREKWQSRSSRALKNYFEETYGIKSKSILTEIDNVIVAFLSDDEFRKISQDKSIGYIVSDTGYVLSGNTQNNYLKWSPAYADFTSLGEVASWGLKATNTNDTYTTSNPVYLIDASLPKNTTFSDHNLVIKNLSYGSYYDKSLGFHPIYTSSILSAKKNSSKSRGVNPTSSVYYYGVQSEYFAVIPSSNIANMLELAYLDSEANNRFSVLNMSINLAPDNWGTPGGNFWDINTALRYWMGIASNRLMITQSAGNDGYNPNYGIESCNYSFVPHDMSSAHLDGVMVIGGYDESGNVAEGWVDPSMTSGIGKSTQGYCIDAWGPAKNITVSSYPDTNDFDNQGWDYNATTGTYISSGTSYAAPFAAAIAARYGNSSTRPPERESFIRAAARHTGYYYKLNANLTAPINGVYWDSTAASKATAYKYIPYTLVSPVGTNLLNDGKYQNTAWNSGGYNASIDMQLNNTSTVSGVKFTPRRVNADGNVSYTVYVMNGSIGNWVPVKSNTVFSRDMAPITIAFTPQSSISRVRIDISMPNSWVALSEVEIYGK